MEIVPIFGENLYAIKYTGEKQDEFRRLFSEWQNFIKLEFFFNKHQADITNSFWGTITIEDAIFKTKKNAYEFEQKFIEISELALEFQGQELEKLFIPFSTNQTLVRHLNRRKSSCNWLRLYALKFENNCYIITGGAIKLTAKIQDRKHTIKELTKINSCRDYLMTKGITTTDKIVVEIEF